MIWQDGPVTVHIGDALGVLRELPTGSVHCIVTSPPYWGLRDYGIPGQLGLEATPEEYIARMVTVFGEVRRVLRKDGTLWLNMGDSWENEGASNSHASEGMAAMSLAYRGGGHKAAATEKPRRGRSGLKRKDLHGIPWRLAFALQADDWWLRSDIIWSKPNSMPESVTDRPTKAHEYVFLLTKSARYFYDAEAVREQHSRDWSGGRSGGTLGPGGSKKLAPAAADPNFRNGHSQWERDSYPEPNPNGRNLRSVWQIATQPYPEAHFATFPEELARRCIAAGTSERGCCPECGAPWKRMVKPNLVPTKKAAHTFVVDRRDAIADGNDQGANRQKDGHRPGWIRTDTTIGWQRTSKGRCPCSVGDHCCCNFSPIPCTILDPFAGSGTTLAVARRMGRRAVGIELQAEYLPLIQRRVSEAALPLLEAINS